MKRLSLLLSLCLVSTLLYPTITLATDAPKLNKIKSPVDAATQVISGKTEPNATITVTGGPYMIAPAHADKNGKFEITIALTQNNKNVFEITAKGNDGIISAPVTITIVENAEEAQKLAEEKQIDNIAPEKPTVDEITSPVDAKNYTVTGTAEAGSTIQVTGDYKVSAKTDDQGKFSVVVKLKQNKTNKFDFVAIDAGNNSSIPLEVTIEEKKAKTEGDTAEEETKTPEKKIAAPFSDVTDHWGEPYIEKLRLAGTVAGYPDGTFGPNTFINRAELTKIALEAFKHDVPGDITEKPFDDVDLEIWYTAYITGAKEENIVQGYPDNTFRPQININRAEALVILLGAAGIDPKTQNYTSTLTDVPESVWFEPFVSYAESFQMIKGYDDKTFRPGNNITRAEVAVIVTKIMESFSKPTI